MLSTKSLIFLLSLNLQCRSKLAVHKGKLKKENISLYYQSWFGFHRFSQVFPAAFFDYTEPFLLQLVSSCTSSLWANQLYSGTCNFLRKQTIASAIVKMVFFGILPLSSALSYPYFVVLFENPYFLLQVLPTRNIHGFRDNRIFIITLFSSYFYQPFLLIYLASIILN